MVTDKKRRHPKASGVMVQSSTGSEFRDRQFASMSAADLLALARQLLIDLETVLGPDEYIEQQKRIFQNEELGSAKKDPLTMQVGELMRQIFVRYVRDNETVVRDIEKVRALRNPHWARAVTPEPLPGSVQRDVVDVLYERSEIRKVLDDLVQPDRTMDELQEALRPLIKEKYPDLNGRQSLDVIADLTSKALKNLGWDRNEDRKSSWQSIRRKPPES